MRPFSLIASLLAASAPLLAQSSSALATIDATDVGCQSSNGLITGGVAVGATFDVTYDQGTGVLNVTVDNTTPVVAGESTAVITDVMFNLPPGAITSATLLSQAGSGGASPGYSLSFDADTSASPNANSLSCVGDFNVFLDNGSGNAGGIANAAATNLSTSNPVTGPVTFSIQLAGPGAGGITAEAVLASFSTNANVQTNVGMKFQGGGVGGAESGVVGSREECRTAVYATGNTAPGGQFDLCVTGGTGCHACLWLSLVAGPTIVGPYTIPVGLPLAAAFSLGNLGLGGTGNATCVSFVLPNNPALSGLTIYATNLTYYAPNPTGIDFSPAFELVVN